VKVSKRALIWAAGLSLPIAGAAFAIWGMTAALGLLLGTLTAILSVLSFHVLAWVLGPSPTDNRAATRFTLMLWLLKLPIIFACVWLAGAVGGYGTTCFLAGLALVYSSLVYAGLRQ
jgi:hypothetical protein